MFSHWLVKSIFNFKQNNVKYKISIVLKFNRFINELSYDIDIGLLCIDGMSKVLHKI